MNKTFKTLSIICATALLVGCGGGGGSTSSSNSSATSRAVQLIDAPIIGAGYIHGDTIPTDVNALPKTTTDGTFDYKGGKVSFYVGNIKIGEVSSANDNKVFLQDILELNRDNKENQKLLRSAQFLQTLDTDSSTDSIEIGSNYSKFAKSKYKNSSLESLDVLTALKDEGFSEDQIKTLDKVKTHLENSIKTYIKNGEDTVAPFVRSVAPRHNSTEVLTNENIVVEFSENISKSSLLKSNLVLKDASGNLISTKKEVLDNKLYIKPERTLNKNTVYTLEIDKNLKDYAGNSLSSKREVRFSTMQSSDTTAPILLTTSPSLNQDGFNISNDMVLTFSEKMDIDTINSTNITLVKKGDDKKLALKVRYKNKIATINPEVLLDPKTEYTLSLSSNVKDANGNAFAQKEISFTTNESFSFNGFEYKIIKSPTTGKYWLDRNLGAVKACEDKADEKCYGDYYQWGRKTNGHEKSSSEIFNSALNPLEKDVLSNGRFAAWGKNWRTNTNDDLWKNSNAINAVCPSGYKVPTKDELLIEIPKQKNITDYTDDSNFLKLPTNGYREYKSRTGHLTLRGANGNVWTNNASAGTLAYSVNYSYLGASASATNRAFGFGVRCIKDYKDAVKPTVVSTTPANNASDVSIDTEFRVQFSKPFISSPSRNNILLKQGDKNIAINIVQNISNHTFVITGDNFQGDNGAALEYNKEYKLIFKKDLYDVSGNTLENDHVVTFTTEKNPSDKGPSISKSFPKANAKNAIRNENIKITFTKELKQNTINANIVLKQGNNVIASIKTYANRVVTINPTNALAANTEYTIEVLADLQSTDDKKVETKITRTFTTSDVLAIEDSKGNIYKEVISPRTGKIWLDRNLGATKVCSSLMDSECFGSYFKWNSANLNACPNSYKVAEISDLQDELEGYTRTNIFDNFLKIGNNGKLNKGTSKDGSSFSYLWTNSNTGSISANAKAMKIEVLNPTVEDESIDNALGIRCIKEN